MTSADQTDSAGEAVHLLLLLHTSTDLRSSDEHILLRRLTLTSSRMELARHSTVVRPMVPVLVPALTLPLPLRHRS
jgi:hypothetical protein